MKLALAAMACLTALDHPMPDFNGSAKVISGDTIQVEDLTVRLFGIEAFRKDQKCAGPGKRGNYACGRIAAMHLSLLIAGRKVFCRPKNVDQKEQIVVALCRIGPMDLGGKMVEGGWALMRPPSRLYEREQAKAKEDGVGAWVGDFKHPYTWEQEQQAAKSAK
jgi:endonuclease YncB( thermonuclease family)